LGAFNNVILTLGKEYGEVSAEGYFAALDTEEILRQQVPRGIIGYETFYDYVHFTPLGAQRIAAALARKIVQDRLPVLREQAVLARAYDYEQFSQDYEKELQSRTLDYPQVDRWLGFNFDKSQITSTNLFKYREGVASLRNMAELGRRDPWIYAFLGNADFHRLNGQEEAEKNYRHALRLAAGGDDDLCVALLENLARLYARQGKVEKQESLERIARTLTELTAKGQVAALDKILKLQ
jgi:hypothetical protein